MVNGSLLDRSYFRIDEFFYEFHAETQRRGGNWQLAISIGPKNLKPSLCPTASARNLFNHTLCSLSAEQAGFVPWCLCGSTFSLYLFSNLYLLALATDFIKSRVRVWIKISFGPEITGCCLRKFFIFFICLTTADCIYTRLYGRFISY